MESARTEIAIDNFKIYIKCRTILSEKHKRVRILQSHRENYYAVKRKTGMFVRKRERNGRREDCGCETGSCIASEVGRKHESVGVILVLV